MALLYQFLLEFSQPPPPPCRPASRSDSRAAPSSCKHSMENGAVPKRTVFVPFSAKTWSAVPLSVPCWHGKENGPVVPHRHTSRRRPLKIGNGTERRLDGTRTDPELKGPSIKCKHYREGRGRTPAKFNAKIDYTHRKIYFLDGPLVPTHCQIFMFIL